MSVTTTWSSRKHPNSARQPRFEGIPHRMKHTQPSAKNATGVLRSYLRGEKQFISNGLKNGSLHIKPVTSRGALISPRPLAPWPSSKSLLLEGPSTGSVTPVTPLHRNHLSVTKSQKPAADQLLPSKSFKGLPAPFTVFPGRTLGESATGRRPEKKGDSPSHDSASPILTPITLYDVLLRETQDGGVCDKADGAVVESLIGDENQDSKTYPLWGDAYSQAAEDLDKKDQSSKALAPEILQCSNISPTKIKSVVRRAHDDDNGNSDNSDDDNHVDSDDDNIDYSNDENKNNACSLKAVSLPEHNSRSTTPPPLDTETGTNRGTGGGSFTTLGYNGVPTFEGLTPSPSGGQNSRKRNRNTPAVGSSKGLSKDKGSLHMACWFAKRGNPCCNGKGYRSRKVRYLLQYVLNSYYIIHANNF
jgi:hypothetical protein